MKEKLVGFKQLFKPKEKEPKYSVPKKKVLEYKGVKRLLAGLLTAFFIVVVITFVRSLTLVARLEQAESRLQKIETVVKNQEQSGSTFDTKKFEYFMTGFLYNYFNVSKDTNALKKRQEILSTYVSKQVKFDDVVNASTRKIETASLIGFGSNADDVMTATYLVNYVINEPVEKERQVDGKTEKYVDTVTVKKSNYVVVEFVTKDNLFSIVKEPYFTAKPIAKMEHTVDVSKGSQNLVTDTTVQKEIDTFLNSFFQKYVAGNVNDLKYIMENPIGLDGRFIVDKLVNPKYYQTASSDTVDIVVGVILQDKGTKFIHQEDFKMVLKKIDGKLKVMSIQNI